MLPLPVAFLQPPGNDLIIRTLDRCGERAQPNKCRKRAVARACSSLVPFQSRPSAIHASSRALHVSHAITMCLPAEPPVPARGHTPSAVAVASGASFSGAVFQRSWAAGARQWWWPDLAARRLLSRRAAVCPRAFGGDCRQLIGPPIRTGLPPCISSGPSRSSVAIRNYMFDRQTTHKC